MRVIHEYGYILPAADALQAAWDFAEACDALSNRLRVYPQSQRDADAGEQVVEVVTSHERRAQGERPVGSRQNEANPVEAMVDSMGL